MPTRRPINPVRLLVVLSVGGGLAALGAAAYAYRAGHIRAAFASLRAHGLAASAAGDWARSVDDLGLYLTRNPDDVQVLVAYAADRARVPLPENRHLGIAIQCLRLALRLEPARTEQRRDLMNLYARTGEATQASDAADAVLAVAPRDVAALRVRTESLTRLRQLPAAAAAAADWCDADPAGVDARLERLELLRATDRPSAEADAAAGAWAASPAFAADPAAADLFHGHAKLAYGDVSDAHDLLSAAAAKLSTARAVDRAAAAALVRDLDDLRDADGARTVVAAEFRSDPSDAVRFDLARRDWEARDFAAVVPLVEGVADRAAVPARVLGLEAVALVELGRRGEVPAVRSAAASRADPTASAWAGVIDQLAAPTGDPAAVVAACRPVLDEVDDPYLRYFAGEAYARLGEPDLAARQWRRAVAGNGTWPLPAVALCRVLTDQGRYAAAFEAGLEAVRRGPRLAETQVTFAAAWAMGVQAGQGRDAAGCLRAVAQLQADVPADGRLPPMRAGVLVAMGLPAEAASAIRAAIDGPQRFPELTWVRLAAISQANGLKLEADCLARNRRDNGPSPAAAYAVATAGYAAGHAAEGLRLFDADRAAAAAARSAGDAVAWDLNRAAYLDLIRDPAAAAAWRALSDAHPAEAEVQRRAVMAACVRDDRGLLAAAVDRLGRDVDRASLAYLLARGRLLIAYGTTPADAAEGRAAVDEVLRHDPDSVDARVLSAQAHAAAGQPTEAVADLRAALDVLPAAVGIRLTLVRLLQTAGNFTAAQEQLDRIRPDDLTGGDQRRQAAALLAEQGQPEQAIVLLEEEARTGQESATARLTLAELYRRSGDLAKAEEAADAVLADAPTAAAVEFTANLLAATGRVEDARHRLDRLADPNLPGTGNGVAELIRGDFALRYGPPTPAGRAEAVAHFAAATAAGPGNPLAWRAAVAADLQVGRPADAVAAADEGLRAVPGDPLLLAVRQQADALAYAAAQPDLGPMLVAVLRDPATTSAAATTLAEIYDWHAAGQPLSQLAQRLTLLSGRFPGFAPLQLYLIGVDQRLGRHDDAIAVAGRAVQAAPENDDLLRADADALASAGRWGEALATADRWRARGRADAAAADRAAAAALTRLGRPAEAVARLQPYADHPGTPAADAALPLIAEARRALPGGGGDVAKLMEPLLASGPAGRLAWMKFAAGTLPLDEADRWVKRALAAMPAGAAAEVVGASEMYAHLADRAAAASPPDPVAQHRFAAAAADLLRPLAAKPDAPPVVLLAAAERAADPAAAADLYRRALLVAPERSVDRLIAQNNLASIVARTGDVAEAGRLIDAALAAWPDAPDLHDTRAFVRAAAGQLRPALASEDEAIRLDPVRPAFRLRRATLLLDDNRPDEAAVALNDLDAARLPLTPAQLQQERHLRDRLAPAAAPSSTPG